MSFDPAIDAAEVRRASHVADLLYGDTLIEQAGKANDAPLTHAVHEDIRAGVEEDTASDGVRPVVVMSEAAKRRFKAADEDRHVAVSLADAVAVNDERTVGTLARDASGRVVVVVATLLCDGVVRDHGVDISRGNEKSETRTTEFFEIIDAFPVGLSENGAEKARVLENASDDSGTE